MNNEFKVFSSGIELGKFSLVAEVLDIRKKDIVLGLSWLKENWFVVDPTNRCLRNISIGWVIPCSVRWIPSVSILVVDIGPLEDVVLMLIIDASE